MKTADITVGETYAVAVYNEADELGSPYLDRGVVVEKGVDRTYQAPGRAYRLRTAQDGILVQIQPSHGDPRHAVVRAQAVKGTWEEHEEIVTLRAERRTRLAAAKATARETSDSLVDRLRTLDIEIPAYKVRDDGSITLTGAQFAALAEAALGEVVA